MATPLVARLLLDAQAELARAADAVPAPARDLARDGQNAPGWVLAHAAFFLDVWLHVDARGADLEACDPWLLGWMRRQEPAGAEAITTSFTEARLALERVMERTTRFVAGLGEAELAAVPGRIEANGWPPGTTVGYLVARAVGHLFAHAGELNVAATSAGAADVGLPGRLGHTAGG